VIKVDNGVVMKKEYIYPDVNDEITKAYIRENEPFSNYWERSEEKVLSLIKEKIEKHLPRSRDSWLLDAGCGTGRLLPEFQKYFSNILAIDPDPLQIEKARETARINGFADKVVFKMTSAELLDWKEESVDVILSSHVIQHVHTKTVPKILSKFQTVLKSDGLLFIMTTHSRRDRGYYVKAILKGSKTVEQKISKEEFNSLVIDDQNILPIHFFSLQTLQNILENSGFILIQHRSYHVLSKTKFFGDKGDRDELVNASDSLKTKFGRDILLIGQKQG
jgi:2-polyprenyl-3-methyl-5-hydroxy-6-metoxy-1,4-benzoquinol methylase